MHIIAIDPGKHECGLVVSHGQGLTRIDMLSTTVLLDCPASALVVDDGHPERVAIIERPYVNTRPYKAPPRHSLKYFKHAIHPEADVEFAMLVGRIQQAVASLGFQIFEAPAWGLKSWINEALSISDKMPDSNTLKKLTMTIAQADQGRCSSWNEHTSAAYCMLRWWLKKRDFEAKCKARV